MILVDYPESDGSDVEADPHPQHANETKSTFTKVVDRSNSHKIRITLPEPSKSAIDEDEDTSEPLAKRPRVGPSAFSSFNALLPAPKRPAVVGEPAGNGIRKGGLGSGVNLRTGATPGFSRESVVSTLSDINENVNSMENESSKKEVVSDELSNGQSQPNGKFESTKASQAGLIKQGNTTMFKPLSVVRKPKKKPSTPPDNDNSRVPMAIDQPKKAAKISLFATNNEQHLSLSQPAFQEEYKPIIYPLSHPELDEPQPTISNDSNHNAEMPFDENSTGYSSIDSNKPRSSLDVIASDLNLSSSAKRQLLGRQRNNNSSNVNIISFSTDQEYAANELLRQAGEQAQHNPVRAIAPGKHSLRQLVSAASSQKDALEEHFASGRRNKKESGSKYGW